MQKIFTDNGLNTLVLDTNVDPTLVNFTDRTKARRCASHGCQDFADWLYFRVRSGLHESCSGQVALAIEQQIDKDTKATFGFVRNSTWALQRRIDTNLFTPSVLPNGMPVYPTFDSAGKLIYASSQRRWRRHGILR